MCRVLAAMMALGETSYKYTTVTCILVAAVVHMFQTNTFPASGLASFNFDLRIFVPFSFDMADLDVWFFADILTYTLVLIFDSGGCVESILAMTKVDAEPHRIDAL